MVLPGFPEGELVPPDAFGVFGFFGVAAMVIRSHSLALIAPTRCGRHWNIRSSN